MLKKILGINLLVFVAYAILININSAVADRGFNIAIGMGVCIVRRSSFYSGCDFSRKCWCLQELVI